MAVRKFYSNRDKPGWKLNPDHVPAEKLKPGEKQKYSQRKYWSWGYDIDLEPVDYDENGNPLRNRPREGGFATRKDAETAAGKIKHAEKSEKHNLGPKESFPMLAQVLQAYVDRLDNPKEKARSKTIFNRWLKLLGKNIRLDKLVTKNIKVYVDARRGKIKDSSINREVNNIASALHNGWMDFEILEDWICPRIPRRKVPRSRRERLITRQEVEALFNCFFERPRLNETERDYKRRRTVGQAFQMLVLTGSRIGEIAGMRWEHIDWQGNILQIYGRKSRYVSTRIVRYLELTPTMRFILQNRKDLKEFGEYVFCRTGNSITHYYKIFIEVAARAGVVYGADKKGGFVSHDARHTAITKLLQNGIDLSTIGSITGHADQTLILHYAHATRESKRIAAGVLDEFGSTGGGGDILGEDVLE